MKKDILTLIICVSILLFSCENDPYKPSGISNKKWKEIKEKVAKESEIERIRQENLSNEMKEKVVELSFMGFQLGAPLSKAIKIANDN
jgi:hypothetical protein